MSLIFYIDPQSGDNLARYDFELLSRIKGSEVIYLHSEIYNYNPINFCNHIPIFSYNNNSNGLTKGLSYCKSLLKLYQLIREKEPSVIHIQWFRIPSLEYRFYRLLKRYYRFKLIHTVHNILPHRTSKNDIKNYGRLYELCDNLICHTESSVKELSTKFGISRDKITVSPHGIIRYETSSETINERIAVLRSKYGIKAKYVFSILGYQSHYKGSDLVLKAWRESELLRDNTNICLVIAGKQSDLKMVKENTDKNVIIIDEKLSDLNFQAFLKMTSVMLLPYRRIDQSGLLLTLINEQIPYCATNIGELTRPFEVGRIGWRFCSPSVTSVKRVLEDISLDLGEIEKRRNNQEAWDKIKKLYSWDEAAKKTSTLYREILS